MKQCIFCKICQGEIPSSKIYEDDLVLAFLDIKPYTEGHTLLIPKKHYRWIWDMPDDLVSHFHYCARKIAKNMQKVSRDDLVLSLSIGTLVDHCHYHLIPNSQGGFKEGLGALIESSRMDLDKDQLKKIEERYRMP